MTFKQPLTTEAGPRRAGRGDAVAAGTGVAAAGASRMRRLGRQGAARRRAGAGARAAPAARAGAPLKVIGIDDEAMSRDVQLDDGVRSTWA